MPGAKVFVDSNVLLYGRDEALAAKARISNGWLREIVQRKIATANLQVLNEVTSVMLRKRRDLTAQEIFAAVDALVFLGTSSIDDTTVGVARTLRLQTGYSWWDCVLLASALQLRCTHFLSEDLHDGHVIELAPGRALTIVDPFAHTPGQILPSS